MSFAGPSDSLQKLKDFEAKLESVISTIREMEDKHNDIDREINKKSKYNSFYQPLGDNDKLLLNRLNSLPKTSGGNLESIASRRKTSLKQSNNSINKSAEIASAIQQIVTSKRKSILGNQKFEPYIARKANNKQTQNLSTIELQGKNFKGRYMKSQISKQKRIYMSRKEISSPMKESLTYDSFEETQKDESQDIIHSSKAIGSEITFQTHDQRKDTAEDRLIPTQKCAAETKEGFNVPDLDVDFPITSQIQENQNEDSKNHEESIVETQVKILNKPKQTVIPNQSDYSVSLVKLQLLAQGEFIEDMYKDMAKKQRLKSVLERKTQIEQARIAHRHNYLKKVRDMNNPNLLFSTSKNTKEKNSS